MSAVSAAASSVCALSSPAVAQTHSDTSRDSSALLHRVCVCVRERERVRERK